MDKVNFLVGSKDLDIKGFKVFDEVALSFLEILSKEITTDNRSRLYPDLITLAFYLRKANLKALIEKTGSVKNRLGRGLTFHITPSNIPLNFAFSYVFSLLAGNANVVRLPSKDFPQVSLFIELFKNVIDREEFAKIKAKTVFVRYPHESTANEYYSALCNTRMIWGGDETVALFKTFKTQPRCLDICFADRYSLALIDCKSLKNIDENALKQLAINFYNDTFAIDQNACSSSKTVLWINSEGADGNALKDKLYKALHDVVISKYELQDSVAVDKFTQLCVDAINLNYTENANCYNENAGTSISSNTTSSIKFKKGEDNLIYRIALKDDLEGVEQLETLSFKAGYFYEANLSCLKTLIKLTNTKFQTLCVYGIDRQQVIDYLIENECTGIDRVVNIGRALDIDVNWDGFDLIRTLSREITL